MESCRAIRRLTSIGCRNMFKLNREKTTAGFALAIFGFGFYSLVTSEVRTYEPVHIRLSTATVQVPAVEPKLGLERVGGERNPFRLSSEWEPVKADPLPLPPELNDSEMRVSFGWFVERAAGAPTQLRKTPLKEVADDDEDGTGDDAQGGEGR